MRAIEDIHAGAVRPPLLLTRLRRLGCWLCLLLFPIDAHAQSGAERCVVLGSSPIGMEGSDSNEPFGALLKTRNDRWSWEPAHGGAAAVCPTCPDQDVAKGLLRLGLAPYFVPSEDQRLRAETGQQSASPVEFALHPFVVATGLWVITNADPRGVTPLTDITPVTLLGVSGSARVVDIDFDGSIVHGVAVALQDRCFSLFAVFFRKNNGAIAIDDLKEVDAALTLDRYKPVFTPAQLAPFMQPAPYIDLPLGDARKRLEEEQQRR